eukprot:1159929-Pelagomonas_calceolata.AAC.19
MALRDKASLKSQCSVWPPYKQGQLVLLSKLFPLPRMGAVKLNSSCCYCYIDPFPIPLEAFVMVRSLHRAIHSGLGEATAPANTCTRAHTHTDTQACTHGNSHMQVSRPHMVLVCALLAGDSRAADALTATLAQQQLPSVLATIEDYMWCKLTLLLASQQGELACKPDVSFCIPFTQNLSGCRRSLAGPTSVLRGWVGRDGANHPLLVQCAEIATSRHSHGSPTPDGGGWPGSRCHCQHRVFLIKGFVLDLFLINQSNLFPISAVARAPLLASPPLPATPGGPGVELRRSSFRVDQTHADLRSRLGAPAGITLPALILSSSAQPGGPSVGASVGITSPATILSSSAQPGGPAVGASVGIASPFGYERSSSANPGAGPSTSAASHTMLMGSGVPPYGLADLQADINRWPAAYYSKQVCEGRRLGAALNMVPKSPKWEGAVALRDCAAAELAVPGSTALFMEGEHVTRKEQKYLWKVSETKNEQEPKLCPQCFCKKPQMVETEPFCILGHGSVVFIPQLWLPKPGLPDVHKGITGSALKPDVHKGITGSALKPDVHKGITGFALKLDLSVDVSFSSQVNYFSVALALGTHQPQLEAACAPLLATVHDSRALHHEGVGYMPLLSFAGCLHLVHTRCLLPGVAAEDTVLAMHTLSPCTCSALPDMRKACEEAARAYRVDAVHFSIALHQEGVRTPLLTHAASFRLSVGSQEEAARTYRVDAVHLGFALHQEGMRMKRKEQKLLLGCGVAGGGCARVPCGCRTLGHCPAPGGRAVPDTARWALTRLQGSLTWTVHALSSVQMRPLVQFCTRDWGVCRRETDGVHANISGTPGKGVRSVHSGKIQGLRTPSYSHECADT